ncbi:MAG: hypothetical protein IJX10_01830, partial [Phascolarctobacterium sp.]|nr:hypothetical protein [Phascolarctobacterium sp.]
MRKKIFYSLFALAFSVLVLATVLFLWISYRQTTAENIQSLKNQAQLLLALEGQGKFDYANLTKAKVNDRITILAPDGKVLFDNYVNVSNMENHLHRQEVQQALKGNEGFATRISETLDKE